MVRLNERGKYGGSYMSENETDLRLLLSVPDTQKALGDLGRTTTWNLIKDGVLETCMIGNRRFVKIESIRRLAAEGANTQPSRVA